MRFSRRHTSLLLFALVGVTSSSAFAPRLFARSWSESRVNSVVDDVLNGGEESTPEPDNPGPSCPATGVPQEGHTLQRATLRVMEPAARLSALLIPSQIQRLTLPCGPRLMLNNGPRCLWSLSAIPCVWPHGPPRA